MERDNEYGGGYGGGRGGMRGGMRRPKVCIFCTEKIKVISYKDGGFLSRFLTENGKIRPRRQTGVCARHQRRLAVAVKRARHLALLPFEGPVGRSSYERAD
ncbi:MAG: 30S ribosomal protein S18 [Anaerolineae bacterium]|nr:30S ribosomal protein S18 [Anaerolineae bacterium]